jgi:hypothetical protein
MEGIFEKRSVSVSKQTEFSRFQSNPAILTLDHIRNGIYGVQKKGLVPRPPWPREEHPSFRRMLTESVEFLTRRDALVEGIDYDPSIIKVSLLKSLATTDVDEGQDVHRDHSAATYPRGNGEEKTEERWRKPGLVVLICLMDGTKFRFLPKSHLIIIYTDKEWFDWERKRKEEGKDEEKYVEIILNKGHILVMHGFMLHAGCNYAAINLR